MLFSIIIPVYNRPDEVGELLESLAAQSVKDFEVIIVEDGSTLPSRKVCQAWENQLDLRYFEKENGGPGPARNFGAQHAKGRYLLILDSDVVAPENYIATVRAELQREDCDAFGGPDRAHASFSPMQKAINYAMTSFFTTGGIRGGKKKLDKFYPRSFNMGCKRDIYTALGGFAPMRFGEDIDFSTRIFEQGYSCRLMPDAWVWHKRRTDLRKFFRQVHNSGIARIHLSRRHPGTLKTVHLLPAAFTLGTAFCLVLGASGALLFLSACLFLFPLLLFSLLILVDAAWRERSLKVGILAIAAAYVQLIGYGSGFLRAWWHSSVCKKGEFEAFKDTFYK